MKVSVNSTLLGATLALSAAQMGLAAPVPQSQNGGGGIMSLLTNIPFLGPILGAGANTLGGPAGSAAASANTTGAPAGGNPLATLQEHLPAAGSGLGGIMNSAQILTDHVKYVSNPPTALEPIPAAQNSPPREAHRVAHVALIPPSMKPANA